MASGRGCGEAVALISPDSSSIGNTVYTPRPVPTPGLSGSWRHRPPRLGILAAALALVAGVSCSVSGSDDTSTTTSVVEAEVEEATTTEPEAPEPDELEETTTTIGTDEVDVDEVDVDEVDVDPGDGSTGSDDALLAEYVRAMGDALTVGDWGFEEATECVAENWVSVIGPSWFEQEGITPALLAFGGFETLMVFSASDSLVLVDEALACGVDSRTLLVNVWEREELPFDGLCVAEVMGAEDSRELAGQVMSGALLELDPSDPFAQRVESALEVCS